MKLLKRRWRLGSSWKSRSSTWHPTILCHAKTPTCSCFAVQVATKCTFTDGSCESLDKNSSHLLVTAKPKLQTFPKPTVLLLIANLQYMLSRPCSLKCTAYICITRWGSCGKSFPGVTCFPCIGGAAGSFGGHNLLLGMRTEDTNSTSN